MKSIQLWSRSGGAVDRTDAGLRLAAKHWLVSIHSLLLDTSVTETPKHVDDSKMATLLFSCNHGDTSSHVFELIALSFGLRAATVQHVVRNRGTNVRFVSLDSTRLFGSRFSFSETLVRVV